MKLYNEAWVDGQILTKLQPQAPQNHYLLSLAKEYLGHFSHAFQSLLHCLELDSVHRETLVLDLQRVTYKLCREKAVDTEREEQGLDEALLRIGRQLLKADLHSLCIQLINSTVQIYRSTMKNEIRLHFYLLEASCHVKTKNKEMALSTYESCLFLALKEQHSEVEFQCFAQLAALHMETGSLEDALYNYLELLTAIEDSKQQPDNHFSRKFWSAETELDVYLKLSKIYHTLHHYPKALTYGKKYLNLLLDREYKSHCKDIAAAYLKVAKLQEKLEFYKEALINYQHFSELSQMTHNSMDEALAYESMGRLHAIFGNYDPAVSHAYQSYYVLEALGDSDLRLLASLRLAGVCKAAEYFEEAENCYKQVWERVSNTKNERMRCEAALGIGEVYAVMSRCQHALFFFEMAINAAESLGDQKLIDRCKFNLANISQFSFYTQELLVASNAFEEVIARYQWIKLKCRLEGLKVPRDVNDILLESFDGIQTTLIKLDDKTKALQYAEYGRKCSFLNHTFLRDEFHLCLDESDSETLEFAAELGVPSLEAIYSRLETLPGTVLYYSLVKTGILLWVLRAGQGLVRFHRSSIKEAANIHWQICHFLQMLKGKSMLFKVEPRNIPSAKTRWETILPKKAQGPYASTSCEKAEGAQGISGDPQYWMEHESWQQMYRLLLEPISDLLEEPEAGSDILIVPDKHLFQIPFSNLHNYKNKKLGDKFFVSLLPSLFAVENVAMKFQSRGETKVERPVPADDMALLEVMGGNNQELRGLQKMGHVGPIHRLVHRTATNTAVVSSKHFIPPFKQIFCRIQALVVGSPQLPSELFLLGRVWKAGQPLITAQKEVLKVAEYLQTDAVLGEEATKKLVLTELPQATIVHIATFGSWEDGVLVFAPYPPTNAQERADERTFLLTIPEILELKLIAKIVVLSSCWDGVLDQEPVLSFDLPTAFLRAGAICVLIQTKPVPDQALLTFYHHFYTTLWTGSYVSIAVEFARHQLEHDIRFPGKHYWSSFVWVGLDTFVNLQELKHAMLHQTLETIDQELSQATKQDWLNPASNISAVPDRRALLLKMQCSLSKIIVNHGSMSSVLKLLLFLITEAISRLAHTGTDYPTVKVTTNIINIPGISSLLRLLGFHFQPLVCPIPYMTTPRTLPTCSAGIPRTHPVAVIFPRLDEDGLLHPAQDAISAIRDLCNSTHCMNALNWITPLSAENLDLLIPLLEKTREWPKVCLRLTDKQVATIWNQPHLRYFLQVLGFEQARLCLLFVLRKRNMPLLLGSLKFFSAVRFTPQQTAAQVRVGTEEPSTVSESSAPPPKTSLRTLKPVLVLRQQIMVQAPWQSVKATHEEERVKHTLAQKLIAIRAQKEDDLHSVEQWHRQALQNVERAREPKVPTQKSNLMKVKMKGPSSGSYDRIPADQVIPTPGKQTIRLRSAAQSIAKEKKENIQLRHQAAVKDLFLPFIQPLP
eukprot:gi/632964777/ref/XP_007898562.1/ PREDICTED: tetratricopeptide repeat protein 28-like [Callorhinchus milii]